jgi:hypothetical protein
MYQKISGRLYGGRGGGGGLTDGIRGETHGVVGSMESFYLDQLYTSYCQRQGVKVSHT